MIKLLIASSTWLFYHKICFSIAVVHYMLEAMVLFLHQIIRLLLTVTLSNKTSMIGTEFTKSCYSKFNFPTVPKIQLLNGREIGKIKTSAL